MVRTHEHTMLGEGWRKGKTSQKITNLKCTAVGNLGCFQVSNSLVKHCFHNKLSWSIARKGNISKNSLRNAVAELRQVSLETTIAVIWYGQMKSKSNCVVMHTINICLQRE